jgi:ATP-dependent RNA helicase RhlE
VEEENSKMAIENLMDRKINNILFPDEVKISIKLTIEEQPRIIEKNHHKISKHTTGPSFHEKKDKNKKQYNLSGGQKIKLKKAKKYKKPITRGSKRKK